MTETRTAKKRKGIVLAGGLNIRLYPTTVVIPKVLLPVYDKPMMYYPLSTLMLAGVRDIAIITSPGSEGVFRRLLGEGEALGVRLQLLCQEKPLGIADALNVAGEYLDEAPSVMVLGDNIFIGGNLLQLQGRAESRTAGATIFAHRVDDPRRFGVIEFDRNGKIVSLEEKPEKPKSSYACTGLYYYDSRAPEFASMLSRSARGELEINDLNKVYQELGCLSAEILEGETTWFDAGTTDSLLEAAQKICDQQRRIGRLLACPEEIAWRNGWIGDEDLLHAARGLANCKYAKYLVGLISR